MRAAKKKKLEAAGWTVGDTEDFLELSPEQNAFVEMKVKLAEAVREQRKRRKWTQTHLADLISSSQSRVAKIEAGDPSVSLDLVFKSLFALGNSPKDVGKILQVA